MRQKTTLLAVGISLVILAACGGGGGTTDEKATPGSPTAAYTTPTPAAGQPVVSFNAGLSTDKVLVFDVVGTAPTTMVRGVTLNLQVDALKLIPASVPGTEGPTARPNTTPSVMTGGWGGGQSVVYRKDRADGYAMMVNSIRNPAPALAANGTMMRFAFSINGNPVSGVIRADVSSDSGLIDTNGKLIPGTAPAMGRLEYK